MECTSVRTYVLREKQKPYVITCRMSGCSELRIIFRHIIPNVLPHLLVIFSTGLSSIIIMISSYAFLGLGLEAGTAEWGAMFVNAKQLISVSRSFWSIRGFVSCLQPVDLICSVRLCGIFTHHGRVRNA